VGRVPGELKVVRHRRSWAASAVLAATARAVGGSEALRPDLVGLRRAVRHARRSVVLQRWYQAVASVGI
jgi:hypothetical protein